MLMNTLPLAENSLSIEDRIDYAAKRAQRRMRWLTPSIFVLYGVMMPLIFLLLNQGIREQYLGLLIVGVPAAIIVFIFKKITDYQKSLFEPSKAQKNAIADTLDKCDYAQAVRLTDDMLLRVAGTAPLNLAATVYLRAGKVFEAHIVSQKAIEGFEQLLQLKQKQSVIPAIQQELGRARAWLGATLLAEQRYPEAEQILVEAMQTNSDDKFAITNYVEALLFQKKEVSLALDLIQKVVELDNQANETPKATPLYLRAWACAIQGDRTTAEQSMSDALRIAQARNHPALIAETRYIEGLMYQVLNVHDQAQRAFSAAVKADPNSLVGQLAARYLDDNQNI